MYTQCPECSVAFRVSADVLKQAAGKVRCGGCGIAFNALEHLSEDKPDDAQPDSPDPALPELQPDEPVELTADTPPESISAEQSAALLKTLDQLAGEDIRIEDTGVEWRVIDEDEVDDEPQSSDDAPSAPTIDEMRFDDNTPLPDDFDYVPTPPPAPVETPASEPEVEAVATQADLAFGEPGEWDDLLGEVDEPAAAETPEEDVEELEDLEALDEELKLVAAVGDQDDDADEDEPLDMDTQFQLQAEAMGIDLSGMHGSDDNDEVETEDEEDKLETSIEEDLMAAAFEAEAAVKAMEDSGARAALDLDELDTEVDDEAFESEEDDESIEFEQDEETSEDDEELETEEHVIAEPEPESEIEIDLQEEDEEDGEDDVEDIAMGFDDRVEEVIESIEASFDEGEAEPDAEPEAESEEEIELELAEDADPNLAFDANEVAEALDMPDMSEEEKTINMMIDQELLAVAVEDEDGFASTIVQVQPDKDDDNKKAKKKDKKKADKTKKAKSAPPPVVETIVMEGESVRDAIDIPDEIETADDNRGISIPLGQANDDYARRGEMNFSRPSAGMIATLVGLVLLLGLQFIHQSREALATVPAFNSAVGPVYRLLGMPLTPTWDIQGWRFEATKGDLDENGLLTIYSRVGNKSEEGLPYPLVHLALTDRFEESMGSIVLEPSDYLPDNADPRRLVPPGNTFNAVISIDSPSPDATSFKLNVCYRLASGQLRCQDASFK